MFMFNKHSKLPLSFIVYRVLLVEGALESVSTSQIHILAFAFARSFVRLLAHSQQCKVISLETRWVFVCLRCRWLLFVFSFAAFSGSKRAHTERERAREVCMGVCATIRPQNVFIKHWQNLFKESKLNNFKNVRFFEQPSVREFMYSQPFGGAMDFQVILGHFWNKKHWHLHLQSDKDDDAEDVDEEEKQTQTKAINKREHGSACFGLVWLGWAGLLSPLGTMCASVWMCVYAFVSANNEERWYFLSAAFNNDCIIAWIELLIFTRLNQISTRNTHHCVFNTVGMARAREPKRVNTFCFTSMETNSIAFSIATYRNLWLLLSLFSLAQCVSARCSPVAVARRHIAIYTCMVMTMMMMMLFAKNFSELNIWWKKRSCCLFKFEESRQQKFNGFYNWNNFSVYFLVLFTRRKFLDDDNIIGGERKIAREIERERELGSRKTHSGIGFECAVCAATRRKLNGLCAFFFSLALLVEI